MLEGTETVERSTRSRFGEDFRSLNSAATSPTMAAASSRSIPGPRGRTRMAFGPRRISAAAFCSFCQFEVIEGTESSNGLFWFKYCILEPSNMSAEMASAAPILDEIPARLCGTIGS